MSETESRELLAQLLEWSAAHVGFDEATSGVPDELHGRRVDGYPHTLWQLVEHIRLAQADILAFCVDSGYREPRWPDDYWPSESAPPEGDSWNRSIADTRRDRAALQALARDPAVDLQARIPHGTGQTYFRELLLVADHTSYHVGQIVALRRLLGNWPATRTAMEPDQP